MGSKTSCQVSSPAMARLSSIIAVLKPFSSRYALSALRSASASSPVSVRIPPKFVLKSQDPLFHGDIESELGYHKPRNYSGVAPERCLKISTANLSACRCLSNDDISNSIRAIAAFNPPSTTGGSLLGLAGNSSGAAAGTAGSPAAPAPAAVLLRYCLDHLRNDQMLTPSSLARSFANTPPVCNRCTAATLKFSSTFFRALLLGIGYKVLLARATARLKRVFE